MQLETGNKLFFSNTMVPPNGLPYNGPEETALTRADEPKE
jgi:hypothetical protein